jgi:hypothetical protein
MSDYQADVQTLEAELSRVEQAFRGLTESDWRRPPCWARTLSRRPKRLRLTLSDRNPKRGARNAADMVGYGVDLRCACDGAD